MLINEIGRCFSCSKVIIDTMNLDASSLSSYSLDILPWERLEALQAFHFMINNHSSDLDWWKKFEPPKLITSAGRVVEQWSSLFLDSLISSNWSYVQVYFQQLTCISPILASEPSALPAKSCISLWAFCIEGIYLDTCQANEAGVVLAPLWSLWVLHQF